MLAEAHVASVVESATLAKSSDKPLTLFCQLKRLLKQVASTSRQVEIWIQYTLTDWAGS